MRAFCYRSRDISACLSPPFLILHRHAARPPTARMYLRSLRFSHARRRLSSIPVACCLTLYPVTCVDDAPRAPLPGHATVPVLMMREARPRHGGCLATAFAALFLTTAVLYCQLVTCRHAFKDQLVAVLLQKWDRRLGPAAGRCYRNAHSWALTNGPHRWHTRPSAQSDILAPRRNPLAGRQNRICSKR